MPKDKLTVNKNGLVCHEYYQPGIVGSKIARELRYSLEYKTNKGWYSVSTYEDELTAHQCYTEANKAFKWRLVAYNTVGRVSLPAGWKPFRY